ncbi:hypothetical protein C1646_763837 [Rhizophagus diaphanus]|nr:hypothetical protein C1646_763837 [Rhizophagus diaphanus] [Rhizophagus sp. MUCL 43196]
MASKNIQNIKLNLDFYYYNYCIFNFNKKDKLILFDNSIYEWDLITEKSIKIFNSDEKIYDYKKSDIKIFSNKEFICIKIMNKLIIYLKELKIPITLNINNEGKPFRGKVVLFEGDFQQILLVVVERRREDIVELCLCQYTLWKNTDVMKLKINIHLFNAINNSDTAEQAEFAK